MFVVRCHQVRVFGYCGCVFVCLLCVCLFVVCLWAFELSGWWLNGLVLFVLAVCLWMYVFCVKVLSGYRLQGSVWYALFVACLWAFELSGWWLKGLVLFVLSVCLFVCGCLCLLKCYQASAYRVLFGIVCLFVCLLRVCEPLTCYQAGGERAC